MKEVDLAIEVLLLLEAEHLTAYYDSEGILTIGVGITKSWLPTLNEQTVLSKDESRRLMGLVLTEYHKDLSSAPAWSTMSNLQRAAMLSFAYNTDYFPGKSGYDSMNRVMHAYKFSAKDAIAAIRKYVNPGSPSEAGLRNRRSVEAKMICGHAPQAAYDLVY